MLDFLMISTRNSKKNVIEIYPKFIIKKSNDLMIRGSDFYAIWIEEKGLWSTDEQDAIQLIDRELDRYYEENSKSFEGYVKVLHLWDAETRMIEQWHRYCQRDMRDNFHMLDEKLIFANEVRDKKDYASKVLPYPLEEGKHEAYDKLMSVLYSDEERHKIEWSIGAIVNGDSKKLQKFCVLYGSAGTGKSTVLNIIQQLFDGYYSVFDARALGSSSNSFALEAFKSNPLVAIQHDGDLSRIEDNTRLNSLVSHELMTVNEKFKSTYSNSFKAFLFMGTNKPVKITDSKSGLIRRLIDITPTGNKVSVREYNKLTKQIAFELGPIAYHCKEIYEKDPEFYSNYIPTMMLQASNDFYNYMVSNYHIFKNDDGVSLKQAWESYKTFCDENKVLYPMSQRNFREELRTYFDEYNERLSTDDGTRVRSYFSGFREDMFDFASPKEKEEFEQNVLIFDTSKSLFDKECAYCKAQYANESEIPSRKWENVRTTLSSLDTSQLHYVKVPENHIVIDFDIPDEDGNKSLEKNIKEASKWPPTYAELSKSGNGIHLHYIYTGDVEQLSRIYKEHIEIKVFTGKSSLRRKLTKCNNHPIATISSGLPLKKGDTKMVNFDAVKSENGLRKLILRNLRKEIHDSTKCSVDFIYKILEEAYESGLKYDVSDMYTDVLNFASNSTHQAEACMVLVSKMKFRSDEVPIGQEVKDPTIIFYDVEVFPNLFLVNWKELGKDKIVRMINPDKYAIEDLLKYRLVGFNCRRYDNHIMYARYLGYTNEQLYELSQKIISGDRQAFFGNAYNLSYTDIYDYAAKKQSLKKWEIELGLHHQELGLPWDQPVPEERWIEVAEYCDNDVISTEAVWNATQGDFTARKILAELAGMTVNDTTNTLTTRIIFGTNKNPQDVFNYRDMGDTSDANDFTITSDNVIFTQTPDEYTKFDTKGRPVFPGYSFDHGHSLYRGEDPGEGGYVYSEPGMYGNVALLDIASMHPSSIIAEELFGPEYTKRFQDIRDARVYIKHKDFVNARKMLNGKLAPFLTDESQAKDLAQALKIAINSVYGLTSAKFSNAFMDPRNKDNIVAKRGALFMINLKHFVQSKGYTVAHIKTDSIKIPNATDDIIQAVMDYGKMYGYIFEHEATYEKLCLVNDAVYVCKDYDGHWSATGTEFQIPYVFKSLFSHEPIEFSDLCETKQVSSALYLDFNENLQDVSIYEKEYNIRYREKHPTKDDREYGSTLPKRILPDISDEELLNEIAKGHDYNFIGKIGLFTPVIAGVGGGLLMREGNDLDGNPKYGYAAGAKGYRWVESETIKYAKDYDKIIDMSYFKKLTDDAVRDISKYGDYEWFVSDAPYVPIPVEDEPPFDPPYKEVN